MAPFGAPSPEPSPRGGEGDAPFGAPSPQDSPALHELGAAEIAARVRAGELRAQDVAAATLARIEATDPSVRAYLAVARERALARAEAIDAAVAAGEGARLGPLAGVPVAVKDNICVRGLPTTAASRILEGYVPPYDATVVQKLDQAGAVIVGKTNLDEFAMGSSTENSGFFPTRNPWALDRVPGGSSGGSVAAVVARSAAVALGSDTGGSIRQPASLCGAVGLKPTYGLVSRYGLLAFASSLDQIGPIARSARDAALLLDAIAGHDPSDSTSVPRAKEAFAAGIDGLDLRGLRVGLPREFYEAAQDEEGRAAVREGVRVLESLGARTVDVSLPHTDYGIATYYVIAPAEASSNLARYDGVHYGYRAKGAKDIVELTMRSRGEGFGPEVKRRIFLGTFVLSSGYYDAYYLKASKVRSLIREDFRKAFEACDVVAGPTSPVPAFKIGEKVEDPLLMYAMDVFTITVNLAGLPGLSVPCGLTKAGGASLPVGLQLIGPAFSDRLLLRLAHAYEQARGPFPVPDLPSPSPSGRGSG